MLLSVLLKNCTESEKNKLIDLYKKSFESTEEYTELKRILESSSFDGYEGLELIEKGRESIREGITNPDRFVQSLIDIRYVIAKSKTLIDKTNEYIKSCNMNDVKLSIFQQECEKDIREFYLDMLGFTCYIASSLFGVEFIKNCKVNMNANIFDFINNVTSEVHSLIYEIQREKLPRKWVIKRCSFSGANLMKYDGFVLLYEDVDEKYISNNMKNASPFIAVSEKASEILCCGVGNFVVTEIENSYNLINSNIRVSLSTSHFDDMDIDYNCINPVSLIKGNDVLNSYVISPSELVDHLNRYFMLKSVKDRRLKGLCAYCGKSTCNKQHFNIPRDF